MKRRFENVTGKLTVVFVVAAFFAAHPGLSAQTIPAFSGAEGAGALAKGGRPKLILGQLQGEVYHVTTLAADPNGTIPGSLRYGMRDENFQVPALAGFPIYPDIPASYDIKPRIIVFDVGGTIVLNNTSPNSDIDMTPRNFTLAGQTAPGGITIYGAEFNPGHRDNWNTDGSPSTTNNLIIRNLTVRTNNPNEKDAFWVPLSNSIVDHVSGSWYTDEGVSITDGARNITVQHSIIGPGWNSPDGDGSQIEGKTPMADISVHHNLYLHNDARIPRVGEKTQATGGPGVELDFRNNVIYNWNDSRAGYGVSGRKQLQQLRQQLLHRRRGYQQHGHSQRAKRQRRLDAPSLSKRKSDGSEQERRRRWFRPRLECVHRKRGRSRARLTRFLMASRKLLRKLSTR